MLRDALGDDLVESIPKRARERPGQVPLGKKNRRFTAPFSKQKNAQNKTVCHARLGLASLGWGAASYVLEYDNTNKYHILTGTRQLTVNTCLVNVYDALKPPCMAATVAYSNPMRRRPIVVAYIQRGLLIRARGC